MVDAHQGLHDLGGGGDLEAGYGAEPRSPQLAQRGLRGVGVGHGFWGDGVGQVLVAGARAMGLVEKACGVGGLEHDPLVFGKRPTAYAEPSSTL